MRNSNMSNSSNYLINFLSMVKGLGFEGVSERKYVLGEMKLYLSSKMDYWVLRKGGAFEADGDFRDGNYLVHIVRDIKRRERQ